MAFKTRKEQRDFEKARVAANKKLTVDTAAGATGSLQNTLGTSPEGSSSANLRTLTRQATEAAFKETGGARRNIDVFREAGLSLSRPETLRAATRAGQLTKGDITDIFQRSLNAITKLDEDRAAGSKLTSELALELPKFYSDMLTDEERSFILQTGSMSKSIALKLAKWRQDNPEDVKTQVVTAGGRTLLIDRQTGNVIRDIGGAYKIDSGAGGISTNEDFWKAVKAGVTSLQKAEQWGTIFGRIKSQFPEMEDAEIDKALGIEWREPGAFEDWKSKQYKPGEDAKWEQQMGIWVWLSSEGADLTNAEKKQQIMGAGYNPEDFGIF